MAEKEPVPTKEFTVVKTIRHNNDEGGKEWKPGEKIALSDLKAIARLKKSGHIQ